MSGGIDSSNLRPLKTMEIGVPHSLTFQRALNPTCKNVISLSTRNMQKVQTVFPGESGKVQNITCPSLKKKLQSDLVFILKHLSKTKWALLRHLNPRGAAMSLCHYILLHLPRTEHLALHFLKILIHVLTILGFCCLNREITIWILYLFLSR